MRSPAGAVWRELVRAAVLLGSIGLIAIGVSGMLAAAFGAVFGKDFVSGAPPGVTYTAQRCAEHLEDVPQASTCADAVTSQQFGAVVGYRIGVGVLGLTALLVWWLVLRRRRQATVLPDAFVTTAATALFGGAAIALLFETAGFALAGASTDGVGGLLSGGVVAAVAAAGSGYLLCQTLVARGERISGQRESASAGT